MAPAAVRSIITSVRPGAEPLEPVSGALLLIPARNVDSATTREIRRLEPEIKAPLKWHQYQPIKDSADSTKIRTL
jgi:hypothetical protein